MTIDTQRQLSEIAEKSIAKAQLNSGDIMNESSAQLNG